MYKSRRNNSRRQPRSHQDLNSSVPSEAARSSLMRTGAGVHGGSKRARNRRARQALRQQLRRDGEF